MQQSDCPNTVEIVKMFREIFDDPTIKPDYINEGGKEAGEYWDYEKTAIQPVELDGFAKVKK